jgi:hypothetical protein
MKTIYDEPADDAGGTASTSENEATGVWLLQFTAPDPRARGGAVG